MSLLVNQPIHQSWKGLVTAAPDYQTKNKQNNACLEIVDKKLRLCKVGYRKSIAECALSDIVDVYRPDKDVDSEDSNAEVTIDWKDTSNLHRMTIDFMKEDVADEVFGSVRDIAINSGADFIRRKHPGNWKPKGIGLFKKGQGEYTCCGSQNKNHPGCLTANHLDIQAIRESVYREESLDVRTISSALSSLDVIDGDSIGNDDQELQNAEDVSVMQECQSFNDSGFNAESGYTSLLDDATMLNRCERKLKTMSLPFVYANKLKNPENFYSRRSACILMEQENESVNKTPNAEFNCTITSATITLKRSQKFHSKYDNFADSSFSTDTMQNIVMTSNLGSKVEGISAKSVIAETPERKDISQTFNTLLSSVKEKKGDTPIIIIQNYYEGCGNSSQESNCCRCGTKSEVCSPERSTSRQDMKIQFGTVNKSSTSIGSNVSLTSEIATAVDVDVQDQPDIIVQSGGIK